MDAKCLHLIRRSDARAIGLKRYLTGAPCPNGHVDERFTSGGQCVSCALIRTRRWGENNSERRKDYYRRYRVENSEAIQARRKEFLAENLEAERARKRADNKKHSAKRYETARKYKEQNRDAVRARMRAWRDENADHVRRYNLANKSRINSHNKSRRARLLQALPAWLTPADFEAIHALYAECSRITEETGVPHHVDHEVPLQGQLVCGLHVPGNLRIITAWENCSKNNRYEP